MKPPPSLVTVPFDAKADSLIDLFVADGALASVDVVEGKKRLGTLTRARFFELLAVAPDAVYGSRAVARLLETR